MKKLVEMMEFQLVPADPQAMIGVDNMLTEWGNVPNPQLSVMLVHLRHLYFVHQTHHWVSKGDTYYGDHLLFQRLYEGIAGEVDMLAEKAIGLGCEANVHLGLQMKQLGELCKNYGEATTLPSPSELAKRSLAAEKMFLAVMDNLATQMKEQGTLSRGLDNLLAGIEDTHEGHVYLLKQRCQQGRVI